MQIELDCPCCHCLFASAPDSPASSVLDQMTAEGPWFALGDGETFEDMIFTALAERGSIRCPECGEQVAVGEHSLGRLAQEILSSW